MAEESSLYDQSMTKSPVNSDIGEDICEKEVGDENEEEVEIDPNFVEERFRVDRRKLEQMIQDPGEDETAEDFFLRVMHQTDTSITWPSKLKIGAKSKKDPHIKVSGDREAVAKAKEMVMTVLDTKSTRVTLKMDVSYTEHSHVIGKGGNNIKRVMQDTGCHIHFPDSNRSNQAEKSNQVSIAGQPSGVEQARAKIRELLPLVFMFELPMTGVLQPIPDANSPTLKQIQDNYAITISFKQRPQIYMTTVIIRGTVHNAKAVKEGTMRVIEHLTGNIGNTTAVSMQLEIAPQHHLFIIGRAGVNIKQIMQQTGATIHFPDPSSTQTPRKGTVYLTGPIESVCLARQHLIGCLPLVLMFDMKEDSNIDQVKMTQLMEQLDVFISIKPKPKQPSKSVIVKSIERNASKLYEARRRLLGLLCEDGIVPAISSDPRDGGVSPSPISFSALGLLGHNLLKFNATNNPLLLLNGTVHRSPLATTSLAVCNQATRTLPSNLITPSPQQGSQLYAHQNVVLVPRHQLPAVAPTVASGTQHLNSTVASGTQHLNPTVATVASLTQHLNHTAATVASLSQHLARQQGPPIFTVPPAAVAANLGGLAVPVTSQQNPKTLKDINQNLQNISPPSSSPSHTGSPLRGNKFANQPTSMESPPSTPPQNKHVNHSNQKLQHSPLHQAASQTAQTHPFHQQQSDLNALKLSHETLLQKLKQSHQYAPVVAAVKPESSSVYESSHNTMPILAASSCDLFPQQNARHPLHEDQVAPPSVDKPTRPPPGLPPPSLQSRPPPAMSLNNSPLDLINHTTATSIASSISPSHDSPPPQIDLSSLKSGQELLDLLLPKTPPSQDPTMAGLSRADHSRSLLNSSAGDLFSAQSVLNAQHLQDLAMQRFNHLTNSSVPPVSAKQGSELAVAHLKPGSPQLPAHPPDSPGIRLPGGSTAMMLGQQSLLSEDDMRNLAFQNGRRSSLVSNHSSDSDSSEQNLVPNPASSFFSGEAILEALDYEHKKLLATKAMSKKPLGESRIPTDYWSGLGFSKSMPDSTIRDKLRENNVRKYQGPSMPTTYEGELSGDEDKDPWKDSPLQSPSNSFNSGLRQRRTPPSPASPIQQHAVPEYNITKGDYSRNNGSSTVQPQQPDWPPTTDLAELFSQLRLGKYTYLFQEQEIDMATFLTLTDLDLKELGITTFGARRKMLLAIADLNKKQTLSAAPGANNPFRKMGTLEKNTLLGNRTDIVSQSGRW